MGQSLKFSNLTQTFLTSVGSSAMSTLGEAIAGKIDKFTTAQTKRFMIGVATLTGGLTQAVTGGNFMRGATTGFAIALLNHVAHSKSKVEESTEGDPVKKIKGQTTYTFGEEERIPDGCVPTTLSWILKKNPHDILNELIALTGHKQGYTASELITYLESLGYKTANVQTFDIPILLKDSGGKTPILQIFPKHVRMVKSATYNTETKITKIDFMDTNYGIHTSKNGGITPKINYEPYPSNFLIFY